MIISACQLPDGRVRQSATTNTKQERASCQSRAPICNIEKTSPVSGPSPDTIPLTDWSIDARMRLAARAARMSLTPSFPRENRTLINVSAPPKKKGALIGRSVRLAPCGSGGNFFGSSLVPPFCPDQPVPIPPTALANRTPSLPSIPPIHSTTRQSVPHLRRSLLVIHFSFSCSRY
jgi:hypothetical protein